MIKYLWIASRIVYAIHIVQWIFLDSVSLVIWKHTPVIVQYTRLDPSMGYLLSEIVLSYKYGISIQDQNMRHYPPSPSKSWNNLKGCSMKAEVTVYIHFVYLVEAISLSINWPMEQIILRVTEGPYRVSGLVSMAWDDRVENTEQTYPLASEIVSVIKYIYKSIFKKWD